MTRHSQTDWRTTFWCPASKKFVHLWERRDAVNFSWVARNCLISLTTLKRARDAGELQVFPSRPSVTQTDWVWRFITERDKSRLIPIHRRMKREHVDQSNVASVPVSHA